MAGPLLSVEGLQKQYRGRWPARRTTFSLAADFTVDEPTVIGVMGPNGSGKTTLFELITGSNTPSAGRVLVAGQDIHRVRYGERDRLAIHYHQSYQVRRFRRTRPEATMQRAATDSPIVHLFDEPQFNTQDGYIGFMLDFFARLRAEGRVVFVCLHPTEPYHVEILRQSCARFLFVEKGRLSQAPSFDALLDAPAVQAYLGRLAANEGGDRLAHLGR